MRTLTDGVVRLRAPGPGDAALLVAGRDEAFHRFLGPGADHPEPWACIEVDGQVVGWIDYDVERSWLLPGEVNVGYNVFAPHRRRGYAARALQLLMRHLATATRYDVATLLIDPENVASQALAAATGFSRVADLDGNPYFKRSVPRVIAEDGVN